MTDWWLQLGFWPQLLFGKKEGTTQESDDTLRARQTAALAGAAIAVVGAPLGYAAYLSLKKGKKKGKKAALTEAEARTGVALENASASIHDIMKTAIASPYFALPLAYIGVQMLEELPAARVVKHPAIPEQGHWYQPPPYFTNIVSKDEFSHVSSEPVYPDPIWVVDKPAVPAWEEHIPAGIITKDLGNAIQSLMALTAAGPIVQGFTGLATSAFKAGK